MQVRYRAALHPDVGFILAHPGENKTPVHNLFAKDAGALVLTLTAIAFAGFNLTQLHPCEGNSVTLQAMMACSVLSPQWRALCR